MHCNLEQGAQHRLVLEVHCSLVQGPVLVEHCSLGQEHCSLVQVLGQVHCN